MIQQQLLLVLWPQVSSLRSPGREAVLVMPLVGIQEAAASTAIVVVALGCSCMVVVMVDSGRGVGLLTEVTPQLVPRGEQLLSKPAIIAKCI